MMTIQKIQKKKQSGEKIVALTAYDYPTARLLDEAGVDIILVGDSLGMVVLGYESTVSVTMREMLHHSKAVRRGTRQALLVTDMPFGSYDTPDQALRNARRLIKEGGAQVVKLEGGLRIRKQIEILVQAGIPVMGHVGMTPQTAGAQSGYRVQGKTESEAQAILEDAQILDQLGVMGIVLECVSHDLAQKITSMVNCPTIGIGAGPGTDGQVLVLHDLLGVKSQVNPKFVKKYAVLEKIIHEAVSGYCQDVRDLKFPTQPERSIPSTKRDDSSQAASLS